MTKRQQAEVYFTFFFTLSILFIGLIERAYDQEQAPAVPAAVNSVAPDDEGTARMSPLDFTTDTLPLSTEG